MLCFLERPKPRWSNYIGFWAQSTFRTLSRYCSTTCCDVFVVYKCHDGDAIPFVFVWIWQDVWQLTTTWNFHLEGTMESISLTWGIVTCVLGKEWRRDSNPVPSDSKSHVLSIGLLLLNPRRAAFRFAKSCVIHWSTVIESAAGCGNCWYGILTN